MITEKQIKELAAELTIEEQIVLDKLSEVEERCSRLEKTEIILQWRYNMEWAMHERLTRIEAHLGIESTPKK
jgi:hypothetical protein